MARPSVSSRRSNRRSFISLDHRPVVLGLGEVLRLERIGPQVVELFQVPEAVGADVLVPFARAGRGSWASAGNCVPSSTRRAASLRQGTASPRASGRSSGRRGRRRREAGRLEDRRRDVDVGDHSCTTSAAARLRAAHQHRHPHRLLVGRALVDQAVLAAGVAVVAHVDDQRRIEQAACCSRSTTRPTLSSTASSVSMYRR